jgi:cytoskeleton protein RodZ
VSRGRDGYNRHFVFEIGNSLREARLRQGLDLARVEDDTKIRAKYLQALEDERFDVLPAETYVKGFLRTYAEYLGLDGQIYVDEFNSRFASAEEPIASSTPGRKPRQRASESSFVVVALAGIVAVAVLVVVAFAFGDDDPSRDPGAGLTAETSTGPPASPEPPLATSGGGSSKRKPAIAKLALTAARGDCWVAVRAGAPNGELLFAGTIFEGETERFTGRRLWLEVGAGQNLNVSVNGKRIRDFPASEPVVVVTALGVRAQA